MFNVYHYFLFVRTAYRKLPFELGPLPPHSPDCCPLALIPPTRRTTSRPNPKNKGKRGKYIRQKKPTASSTSNNPSSRPASGASSPAAEPPPLLPEREPTPDASREMRIQKRLLKLQKHLELNALPGLHTTATTTSRAAFSSTSSSCIVSTTAKAVSLERKMHKRKLSGHLIDEHPQDGCADQPAAKHKPGWFLDPVDRSPSSSPSIYPPAHSDVQCTSVNPISNFKSILTTPLSCVLSFFPSTVCQAPKKETFLLDINGRPRKSPREHASTLAILSHLVQQRRKREKELNGGVSPEKRAPPPSSSLSGRHQDDTTSRSGDDEDDYQSCGTIETEQPDDDNSVDSCAMQSFKMECDSEVDIPMDVAVADSPLTPPPEEEPAEEENSIASHPPTQPPLQEVAVEPHPPTPPPPARKRDSNAFPRMPICDYVNPHLVCRQIDELLSAADDDEFHFMFDAKLASAPPFTSPDPDDMVLISTPRDFLEIVTSVEDGPLRYRNGLNLRKPTGLSSFSRRKRKNNRTGWPSLPRRRMLSGATQPDGTTAVAPPELEEDTTCSVSNGTDEDSKPAELPGHPIDITQRLLSDEFHIATTGRAAGGGEELMDAGVSFHSKFTVFGAEGRDSVVFTSSSDKAENSDIFTVSSDSLDTADMTTTTITSAAVVVSSGIASGSPATTSQPTSSADMSSMRTQPAAPASIPDEDDASSADVTLAELMQKQMDSVDDHPVAAPIVRNGKARRRSSVMSKSPTRRVHLMQPVIRVKKMSPKMLLASAALRRRSRLIETAAALDELPHGIRFGHQTPPPVAASNEGDDAQVVTITGSGRKSISRQSCSPKSKFSPPKLRKPRGRWYRER